MPAARFSGPARPRGVKQELEGICFAPMVRNGKEVQLRAVPLENLGAAKDNVFFKSWSLGPNA